MPPQKLILKQLNFPFLIRYGYFFSTYFVVFSMSRAGLKNVVAYPKDKNFY
jgi:hypothetical protein